MTVHHAIVGINSLHLVHPPKRQNELPPAGVGRGSGNHATVAALWHQRQPMCSGNLYDGRDLFSICRR